MRVSSSPSPQKLKGEKQCPAHRIVAWLLPGHLSLSGSCLVSAPASCCPSVIVISTIHCRHLLLTYNHVSALVLPDLHDAHVSTIGLVVDILSSRTSCCARGGRILPGTFSRRSRLRRRSGTDIYLMITETVTINSGWRSADSSTLLAMMKQMTRTKKLNGGIKSQRYTISEPYPNHETRVTAEKEFCSIHFSSDVQNASCLACLTGVAQAFGGFAQAFLVNSYNNREFEYV
jgi:hypothetical protein